MKRLTAFSKMNFPSFFLNWRTIYGRIQRNQLNFKQNSTIFNNSAPFYNHFDWAN